MGQTHERRTPFTFFPIGNDPCLNLQILQQAGNSYQGEKHKLIKGKLLHEKSVVLNFFYSPLMKMPNNLEHLLLESPSSLIYDLLLRPEPTCSNLWQAPGLPRTNISAYLAKTSNINKISLNTLRPGRGGRPSSCS